MHTFADAFQGCYKNGTNGSRDFRYFAVSFSYSSSAAFITQSSHMWLILIPFTGVVSLLFVLIIV